MNPRRLLTIGLLSGALLAGMVWLLTPSAPPPPTPPPPPTAVGFDTSPGWVDFAYQPLAIPTGLMAEVMRHDTLLRQELASLGLRLRLQPVANGEEINRRAQGNKPELAATGDMPALTAAATRPVRLMALTKIAFVSLVARKALPVQELRGKRIANASGTSAHHMLLNALHQAGIKEQEVTLVESSVNTMAEALAKGEVEAFAAWEPTPTQALTAHPEFAIIHRLMIYGHLFLDTGFVQQQPQATTATLAAYLRALQWMAAQPEHLLQACRWNGAAVQQFTGQPPRLKEEHCAAITRRDLLDPAPTALIPESLLEKDGIVYSQFTFLKKIGMIAQEVSWERVHANFDLASLRRIATAPERYHLRQFAYDP